MDHWMFLFWTSKSSDVIRFPPSTRKSCDLFYATSLSSHRDVSWKKFQASSRREGCRKWWDHSTTCNNAFRWVLDNKWGPWSARCVYLSENLFTNQPDSSLQIVSSSSNQRLKDLNRCIQLANLPISFQKLLSYFQFFSKPEDVIAASMVLLLLPGEVNEMNESMGFWGLLECQFIQKNRWWQLKYFLFSPPIPGVSWSNLTNIFQKGWFNHQLEQIWLDD